MAFIQSKDEMGELVDFIINNEWPFLARPPCKEKTIKH